MILCSCHFFPKRRPVDNHALLCCILVWEMHNASIASGSFCLLLPNNFIMPTTFEK